MIVNGIRRRSFMKIGAGVSIAAAGRSSETSASGGSFTDVGGIKVGHFTDTRRPTGCTVILFDEPAVAGVDVLGAAGNSRNRSAESGEHNSDGERDCAFGGSAFGLDAASGVVRYLDERGIRFPAAPAKVPIVPAAILFDLNVGDPKIRPTAESGYAACKAATRSKVEEGNVGAGRERIQGHYGFSHGGQ